ncbi:cation diffusion facilitator family transporter [Methylococcus mesophilus]|uniref:cation diffusion facilitator family transporter n=1 Tax=Methylococcus mesophilus TaxID=2993564 RepID=UPI00224B5D63|nr:cation diffusion facilitator family transporter [Methylococcus mesophilus]UZR30024.1 cation diffusion facilitator family transporter [Methylococcus mesophilus]
MPHDDHEHHHAADSAGAQGRLVWALIITAGFVVFEALAGWKANSLALLTDAVHNLSDVLALGLSWYAMRLTAQPAHAAKTFGYHRAGILAALANSAGLVVVALYVLYDAYGRLQSPAPVQADILIGVGGAALLVNAFTAWLVHHGSHDDLNMRSAFLHLLGDVVSTLGAIAAGVAIHYTGLYWLDPAVSILIALLIIWNAKGLLAEVLDILLESTPRDVDMSSMVRDLMQVEGVRGVHHLHVWSISRQLRMLSAHIVTDDIRLSEGEALQKRVTRLLARRYGIARTTLQLESESCQPDLLYCDISRPNHRYHEE